MEQVVNVEQVMVVLVLEVAVVLVGEGRPHWGCGRMAFASQRSSPCASRSQVAERGGAGEDGEDPVKHRRLPLPEKLGGQLPAGPCLGATMAATLTRSWWQGWSCR